MVQNPGQTRSQKSQCAEQASWRDWPVLTELQAHRNNFLKTFFFYHITCVRFLSPEETFKLFIIFYFWLINTDMTDVVLEHTVRNYKKNNNIFFPSGLYNETIQI